MSIYQNTHIILKCMNSVTYSKLLRLFSCSSIFTLMVGYCLVEKFKKNK